MSNHAQPITDPEDIVTLEADEHGTGWYVALWHPEGGETLVIGRYTARQKPDAESFTKAAQDIVAAWIREAQ